MAQIKDIIAKNLIDLRKKNNLTQNELAMKLNYSDNTVSRWERGELVPSVETLQAISEFYDVPLEHLLKDNVIKTVEVDTKAQKIKKLSIVLLSVSLVWFCAILAYFYCATFFDLDLWIVFIWALPASFFVLYMFNLYLKRRVYGYTFLTFFIWTFILSFYLHFIEYNMFLLFLVGIPAQMALSIYYWVRPKRKKKKSEEKQSEKKPEKK